LTEFLVPRRLGVKGEAMNFNYSEAPYRIRDDIPEAHRLIWKMIAKPGNWWKGADRVAILSETRHAVHCELCKERQAALPLVVKLLTRNMSKPN
jgi:hypothetical protein